ncbi:UDP-N-acetylglucosamine 4,6-dehydratase (inverting) [Candidatus Sumerlaeota bacterium]
MSDLAGKSILITGGTGSLGHALVGALLERHDPRVVRIYSRDEHKQDEMARRFQDPKRLRFFLGCVRERDRLMRACEEIDVIIHAAALKQVPAGEYNPFEAVKTNILGAQNVIDAAIDLEVPRVINVSTDKAVNPINLYGATKLCAEKIFINGNAYTGKRATIFSGVRYGNVVRSRGSVIPVFEGQRDDGVITVTDKRMTRFWITLEQAAGFVLAALGQMTGGEIFIPRIPSMRVLDLAEAVAPGCKIKEIGIRQGEKLHEALISSDEARCTVELKDQYVIRPAFKWKPSTRWDRRKRVAEDFSYASDNNSWFLSVDEMRQMLEDTK